MPMAPTRLAAVFVTLLSACARQHESHAILMRGGASASPASAQPPVEWTVYGRDAAGTKYSPAAEVTRDNVRDLVPVWTYRTGDFARGGGTVRDETTALYVDGIVYASTPFGGVRALDTESGREIWSFDSELDLSAGYGDPTNRGVSTWLDATRPPNTPCHRRIYVATLDARLIALDGRSGARCQDFGADGQVDLSRGVLNIGDGKGEYSVTSPPAVVNGLVIVGSTVADNRRANAPAGVVRAFDARTGAPRWSWDPVPREASEPAYSTWRGSSGHQTGAANAWSIISSDSARDLIFVPTGSPSPDFFGGERLGRNDYANSVVALRATTGRVVWHYQVVHHDLWDYDVPAEPVLIELHRNGRTIPAVVQTTKMGYVFILNRETGEPLFPVEERAVPKSDVAGEEAWPTQPVPRLPAPLGPTRFTDADPFAVNDSSRAWCRAQLAGARSEGIFTPPSLRGSVIFPGNIGGSNWSGVAVDPVRHLAIIPSNRLVTVVDLIPRSELHERAMGGTRFDEFAAQTGTPYAMRRRHLIAPDGVPCNAPPWGVLTAIDLETGATKWVRPFGRIASLVSNPASAEWGSPNLGGGMVTAGGVAFVGGALDQRLHAFDVESGAELWSAELPAGVHGSPMTFVTPAGQQYVIVAAGGHREVRDKVGDYIVAFALRTHAHPAAAMPPISSGHYRGHLVLDRSRFPVQLELTVTDSTAAATFVTSSPRIEGSGRGRATRDSIAIDGNWTFAAQHCSGTIQFRGSLTNSGHDLIGEVEYVDGCADHRAKQGTFAVRRE